MLLLGHGQDARATHSTPYGYLHIIERMPRFVVLWHEMPPSSNRASHYDFMLERGATLRTWTIIALPAQGATVEGQSLDNHRLDYLDYEGPVSGDRGHVTPFDRGTYRVSRETDDMLVVDLRGEKLRGRLTIERSREADQRWRFFFEAEPMVST